MAGRSYNETATVRVGARLVLATIAGFWLFYFVAVTARSAIIDDHWQMFLLPRSLVSLAGALLTIMLWLIVRRFDAATLPRKFIALMLAAVPLAIALSAINHAIFDRTDKSMLDDGRTTIVTDRSGRVVIDTRRGIEPDYGPGMTLVKELSDIAIGRYFLLIAWGALYTALGFAAQVQAAERRAAAFARAAKSAELRSLRYQVNPHFLFNTLNSLSALVMTGRKHDAETMIQTLSTFYRTSLTGDPTVDVRLSEEIGFQQLYLDIEAVRFPARLRIEIELPDAIRDLCVPGLILQPLVENAVKHGVAATSAPVTIRIVARLTGDAVAITVADDAQSDGTDEGGSGIGLANVRDRLAARYDDARLEIARPLAGGFEATVVLPIVRDGC